MIYDTIVNADGEQSVWTSGACWAWVRFWRLFRDLSGVRKDGHRQNEMTVQEQGERCSRIELKLKTGNFPTEKQHAGTRHEYARGAFSIRFFQWALSGASTQMRFSECATSISA